MINGQGKNIALDTATEATIIALKKVKHVLLRQLSGTPVSSGDLVSGIGPFGSFALSSQIMHPNLLFVFWFLAVLPIIVPLSLLVFRVVFPDNVVSPGLFLKSILNIGTMTVLFKVLLHVRFSLGQAAPSLDLWPLVVLLSAFAFAILTMLLESVFIRLVPVKLTNRLLHLTPATDLCRHKKSTFPAICQSLLRHKTGLPKRCLDSIASGLTFGNLSVLCRKNIIPENMF